MLVQSRAKQGEFNEEQHCKQQKKLTSGRTQGRHEWILSSSQEFQSFISLTSRIHLPFSNPGLLSFPTKLPALLRLDLAGSKCMHWLLQTLPGKFISPRMTNSHYLHYRQSVQAYQRDIEFPQGIHFGEGKREKPITQLHTDSVSQLSSIDYTVMGVKKTFL